MRRFLNTLLVMLVNSFAIAGFVTMVVLFFSCYLLFGHVLLGAAGRNNVILPRWIRTISVTAQFTLVYFTPSLRMVGGGTSEEDGVVGGGVEAVAERLVAGDVGGSGGVAGVGGAVNIETTSPSARERIIQSVGAPVVTGERIPPVVGQDGGGGE